VVFAASQHGAISCIHHRGRARYHPSRAISAASCIACHTSHSAKRSAVSCGPSSIANCESHAARAASCAQQFSSAIASIWHVNERIDLGARSIIEYTEAARVHQRRDTARRSAARKRRLEQRAATDVAPAGFESHD
jgi:hypothetical protein